MKKEDLKKLTLLKLAHANSLLVELIEGEDFKHLGDLQTKIDNAVEEIGEVLYDSDPVPVEEV